MGEEQTIHESHNDSSFRNFVTSEEFITRHPQLSLGGQEPRKSRLVSYDASNQFAILEFPPPPILNEQKIVRYHYLLDPTNGEYKYIGIMSVFTNFENSSNQNISIRKYDENFGLREDVMYFYGLGSDERMAINLTMPDRRFVRGSDVEIAAVFSNDKLESFKYVPPFNNGTSNLGNGELVITRSELQELVKEKEPITHMLNDQKCSFDIHEVDGAQMLKVDYSISEKVVEKLLIPLEISIEGILHELVPQDVQRMPDKTPSSADLWMEKDIPATIFGEGWQQSVS